MRQDNAIRQMIRLSEGLIDLCHPLQELGIHLFNALINYDDNRQIYLCNNPQWVCEIIYMNYIRAVYTIIIRLYSNMMNTHCGQNIQTNPL